MLKIIGYFAAKMCMQLSNKDRFGKGKEFQSHVKNLLLNVGYLDGKIYLKNLEYDEDYYGRLLGSNKLSYTSPSIQILNRWDEPERGLDTRFGLACSRRDPPFNRYNNPALTFPMYQRKYYERIQKEMNIPIYIIFGRKTASSFGIAVTQLKEPDECIQLRDESTESLRWTDIYYSKDFWSWKDFIKHRIDCGDPEPKLDKADAPYI
jgi:hypothetical protein